MAARIEEVYDNLEVRCSVTNLTGTQSDQLNLPDWVLRLFDGEKIGRHRRSSFRLLICLFRLADTPLCLSLIHI